VPRQSATVQAVVVLQVPEEPVLRAERAPALVAPVRAVPHGVGSAPVVVAHVAMVAHLMVSPMPPNVMLLRAPRLVPMRALTHVAAFAVMTVCAGDTRCRQ
jgi:hypothetical protein